MFFLLCLLFLSAHANLPSYPAVERLMQQTVVVRQYLDQEQDKVALSIVFPPLI